MRALEIQKVSRMTLSVIDVSAMKGSTVVSRRSSTEGRDDVGRILLIMRAIWRRIARRTEGIPSVNARLFSSCK